MYQVERKVMKSFVWYHYLIFIIGYIMSLTTKESLLKDEKNVLYEETSSFNYTYLYWVKGKTNQHLRLGTFAPPTIFAILCTFLLPLISLVKLSFKGENFENKRTLKNRVYLKRGMENSAAEYSTADFFFEKFRCGIY